MGGGITFFILEFLRFITLYLVCYFYCLQSSGILPQKRGWSRYYYWLNHRFLMIFFVVNCIWILLIFLYVIIKLNANKEFLDASDLCKKPLFIYMRIGSFIISLVFCRMGSLISQGVKRQTRITDYE
jgi:hypothetical protein